MTHTVKKFYPVLTGSTFTTLLYEITNLDRNITRVWYLPLVTKITNLATKLP